MAINVNETVNAIMSVAAKCMKLDDEAREYVIGFINGWEAAKAAVKEQQEQQSA